MIIKKQIAAVLFASALTATSTQVSAGIIGSVTNTLIGTTSALVGSVESALNSLLDMTYGTLSSTATKIDDKLATLPSPLACAAAYATLINASNAQLQVDLNACASAHASTSDLPGLTTCSQNAVAVSSAAIDSALAATQACLDSHFQ